LLEGALVDAGVRREPVEDLTAVGRPVLFQQHMFVDEAAALVVSLDPGPFDQLPPPEHGHLHRLAECGVGSGNGKGARCGHGGYPGNYIAKSGFLRCLHGEWESPLAPSAVFGVIPVHKQFKGSTLVIRAHGALSKE